MLVCFTLLLASVGAHCAPPPPNIKQCKSRWVVTSAQPLAFGTFSIELGSGSLVMDSNGLITPTGAITLSNATPTTAFTVTVNNTLDPAVCGTYGFDLSWGIMPAPLAGAGTTIPLTNILVSEPTLAPTPTALPLLGLSTANLPLTFTFQGTLTTTFPQAAGLYTSPAFTVDLTQSGTIVSLSSTATATSASPLNLAETISLNFGTIAAGTVASSVTIDTLGQRSVTGDAAKINVLPGTAGTFQLTGEPNLSYSTLISTTATLDNGAGAQIIANSFTHNSSGTIPPGGIETFNVGATLNLAPLQTPGTYSTATGSGIPYSLTVNYN
ncbi:MAG: DUF4402 domain-containing protein [Chromatiales bacterium]|nr:DUF4402 domain-containing protein [Chromatiales bacterium]